MTRTKLIAGALGALLLLAGGGVGFMAWRLKPAIAESAPLPGIALTDLAGKPYDLAQHKGKVLVLDFWSSTWGGCIELMRDMSKFEHEYQQRGVVFLAVDAFEPIEGAREFVKTTDLRYTWLRAEAEALEALGVRGVPTQIIVDRAGKVAWTSSLASTSRGAPAIQEALDAVLAQ